MTGALQLLHLVLDLGVSVVHGHVQQQHLLQLPAHKTVLDGAADLRTGAHQTHGHDRLLSQNPVNALKYDTPVFQELRTHAYSITALFTIWVCIYV